MKAKTHWQWAFGCATAVYHVIAPTRGKCVPTDFLAGVRPKVWLSDRLPAQCTHAEAHQKIQTIALSGHRVTGQLPAEMLLRLMHKAVERAASPRRT